MGNDSLRPSGGGEWGEEKAARFLSGKGYRILGRRVRPDAHNELDIVARDGDVLVFIEVKTRGSEDFGSPISAVDARKRRALSRAAVHYLGKLRYPDVFIRFDVVEVIGSEGMRHPEIRHVENAFALDGKYRLPYRR